MITKEILSVVLNEEVTDIQRLDDIRILSTEFNGYLVTTKENSFLVTSPTNLADRCKLFIQDQGYSININRGKALKFDKREVCIILRNDVNSSDFEKALEEVTKIFEFEKFFYLDGIDESEAVFEATKWVIENPKEKE